MVLNVNLRHGLRFSSLQMSMRTTKQLRRGQLGFSIHGNGVLKLSEQLKKANKMKKRKFIAHFADTETTDGGEIIVTTEELKEGAEVVVIGEDFTPQEGFSGEVFIEDTPVTIENDVITAIGNSGRSSCRRAR
jgi:hypothetical protein